jgi:hypothetical protein
VFSSCPIASILGRQIASPANRPRQLRPLEVKSDLEIAVRSYDIEIVVPGFARVDAELVVPFAGQ